MTFYHGSPVGGLTQLEPFLSEHSEKYVYFATNPLVALLYAVKPVPKPFSFYPYGFDSDGNVVYSEYFKNAFEILYKGKKGYLYECDNIPDAEQPTQINCAYTSRDTVKVDRITETTDLYEYFKAKEKEGVFRTKPFGEISENEMNYVLEDMRNAFEKYNLKSNPDNHMRIFIERYFPTLL